MLAGDVTHIGLRWSRRIADYIFLSVCRLIYIRFNPYVKILNESHINSAIYILVRIDPIF